MANLSAIKLPNGTTYNLVDKTSGYTKNTGTITSIKTTAGAHTAINVSSGAVTFNVPTKTSHLTNDSNFITLNNIESTSIPTADIIAEFDSAAHMSSTDMTTSEVSDFVNSLNVGGGDEIINLFYPVGSYYETSDTTFDPNIAWGGTWVLEAEGIVHVSAGTSYPVTHANDNAGVGAKDGGDSTVTLSLNQIPSHNHGSAGPAFSWNFLAWSSSNPTGKQGGSFNIKSPGSGSAFGTVYGSFSSAHTHSNNGGGQAHENMQPYIVVNRWHRTA